MLGMVTRNRFKRLIHEQFARILQVIERGGMAAYISGLAIDAALTDSPLVGQTNASKSSHSRDEKGGGDGISMTHLHARSGDFNFGDELGIEGYMRFLSEKATKSSDRAYRKGRWNGT